jgi:phage terminase large subunit GpA-like protein
VRRAKARRVIAGKGASTPGRVILGKPSHQDVNWRGQTIKKGVALYTVGADTGKHLLYNLINGDNDRDPGERKLHFSQQLEPGFYDGLVSETYNPRKNRWELKKGKRNEPLDTWNYANAASHHPELYLHKWKPADWKRRAAMVEPENQQQSRSTPTPRKKPTPPSNNPYAATAQESSTPESEDERIHRRPARHHRQKPHRQNGRHPTNRRPDRHRDRHRHV